MNSLRLPVALLCVAVAVAGCGRKNLPVAPRAETPVGAEADPAANAPSSLQNFQRAGRVSIADSDLTISPAEVTSNPGAPKKSFPLDFLLN